MEPTMHSIGERRHSFRVPVSAAAGVRVRERTGFASTYAVHDLSLGGVLLSGEPAVAEGVSVDMVIRVAGAAPIHVSGTVVRHVDSTLEPRAWAARFDRITAAAEDVIHDLSVARLEKAPSVLVVVRSRDASARLASEIRSEGLRPMTATTPLEAVTLLEDSRTRIASVVIGEVPDAEGRAALLDFVRDEYPSVRRVTWASRDRRVARGDLASGRADAMLFGRWDRTSLARALGIDSARWRRRIRRRRSARAARRIAR